MQRARCLDYRVFLVPDGVAATSRARHAAALRCLGHVFARLTTTRAVVAVFRSSAKGDPNMIRTVRVQARTAIALVVTLATVGLIAPDSRAGLLDDIKKRKEIAIATEAGYAPFESSRTATSSATTPTCWRS